jgi:hypothetical protein
MIRELRLLRCEANVLEKLDSRPFCTCNFRLSDFGRLSGLHSELRQVIEGGLKAFKSKLAQADTSDKSLREVTKKITAGKEFPSLTATELRLLSSVSIDPGDEDILVIDEPITPRSPGQWPYVSDPIEVSGARNKI